MKIDIAGRLRPFSHCFGTFFVLPGTCLRIQVFPALIRIHDLSQAVPRLVHEIPVPLQGPVADFTVQQDLEQGFLLVWGKTSTGFMRYRIERVEGDPYGSAIVIEKKPSSGFSFEGEQRLILSSHAKTSASSLPKTERLSFGCHKAQDWELMQRRCEMSEILPFWMRLGSVTPSLGESVLEGTASLLQPCLFAIERGERARVLPALQQLYQAGFEGGLSPTLIDTSYQGFTFDSISGNSTATPLSLLTQGAQMIRSLFVQSRDHQLDVLPVLPPAFHCGRFTQISLGALGMLDLEWSKGWLRRMVLSAESSVTVELRFQKGLKEFRLRRGVKDRGRRLSCKAAEVALIPGERYLLDQFEK